MDTSDAWIRSRTGIRQRHIATKETTTTLAVEAARKALQDAGTGPEELDLILAATITPEYTIPMLSCQVQAALGADRAVAFDINAACSGFLFALITAEQYLRSGAYQKALIIGAENLSKVMDWSDRSSSILFGDGAGAVVIRREETDERPGLLAFSQGAKGSDGMVLSLANRPLRNPFLSAEQQQAAREKTEYVHMDGQAVYQFAVRTIPQAIRLTLQKCGLCEADVDLFLLHQANLRIIESVARHLHQPMEKFPVNVDECGNVSAASVPILLDKIRKDGKIKENDTLVLAGFGAGLTWGVCVINW